MVTVRIPKELYNTKITFEQFCVCQMQKESLEKALEEEKDKVAKLEIRNNALGKEKRLLYKIQSGKDMLTGELLNKSNGNIHIHHILPVEKGGGNNLDNLVLVSEETHKNIHGSVARIVYSENVVKICRNAKNIELLNYFRKCVGNEPLLLNPISPQNNELYFWDSFQEKVQNEIKLRTQEPKDKMASSFGMYKIVKAHWAGYIRIPLLDYFEGKERLSFVNKFVREGELNYKIIVDKRAPRKNTKHLEHIENEYSGVIEFMRDYVLPLEEVSKVDIKRVYCWYKQGNIDIPQLHNMTITEQMNYCNSFIRIGAKYTYSEFAHYNNLDRCNKTPYVEEIEHYYSDLINAMKECQ